MLKCDLKLRQQNAFFIIFVFFTFWKIPKLKDQLSLLSFEWKKNLKSSRIYRTCFRLIELILLLKFHDFDKLFSFILFFVFFLKKEHYYRNQLTFLSWECRSSWMNGRTLLRSGTLSSRKGKVNSICSCLISLRPSSGSTHKLSSFTQLEREAIVLLKQLGKEELMSEVQLPPRVHFLCANMRFRFKPGTTYECN